MDKNKLIRNPFVKFNYLIFKPTYDDDIFFVEGNNAQFVGMTDKETLHDATVMRVSELIF